MRKAALLFLMRFPEFSFARTSKWTNTSMASHEKLKRLAFPRWKGRVQRGFGRCECCIQVNMRITGKKRLILRLVHNVQVFHSWDHFSVPVPVKGSLDMKIADILSHHGCSDAVGKRRSVIRMAPIGAALSARLSRLKTDDGMSSDLARWVAVAESAEAAFRGLSCLISRHTIPFTRKRPVQNRQLHRKLCTTTNVRLILVST